MKIPMAKFHQADLYILIALLIGFAVSLFLPFEAEFLHNGQYDIDARQSMIVFGYGSRICFALWIAAGILIITGLFKGKAAVITLTAFFAIFFGCLLALGYSGGPFYPLFKSGFYVSVFGSFGAAVYAHFLAFRKG